VREFLRSTAFAAPILAACMVAMAAISCADKTPPGLTPDAQIAFQATRVVKSLDVLRDAAIAGHDLGKLSEGDTREVVTWHKTVVQVIQITPNGWKAVVQQSIYLATCDPRLAEPPRVAADPMCDPKLPNAVLVQLAPYVGVVVLVVKEVM